MGRPHRIQFPGIIYHVFTRGNEKMNIYNNDSDRKLFMKLVSIAKQKYKFTLYAYVLMPNHYHLLIKPAETGPLSKIMQYINGRYSHGFNWRRDRVGHLFEKRYKNIAVEDSEYLFDVIRYIHLNPVRKRLVKSPEVFEWSSHNEYLGRNKTGLIYADFTLNMLAAKKHKAIKVFRDFVGNAGRESAFTETVLRIDRLVAGSSEFAGRLYERVINSHLKAPAWSFKTGTAKPDDILNLAASRFDVSREEIITKKGKWNRAKKAAVYLMWKYTGLSAPEIAGIFSKQHPSGINHIIASAEKQISANPEYKEMIESFSESLFKTSAPPARKALLPSCFELRPTSRRAG